MENLKINLDQLKETINNYKKSIYEFESLIKTLEVSLDALKNSGWNSSASMAYFQNFDQTWKKNMTSHIKIVTHLKECLENAEREYQRLYDTIPSIGNSL